MTVEVRIPQYPLFQYLEIPVSIIQNDTLQSFTGGDGEAEIDIVTLTGNDFYPQWPDPVLSDEQRLGEGSETYTIYFDTNKGDYAYNVSDSETFQRFQINTTWDLEINALGSIVSVAP